MVSQSQNYSIPEISVEGLADRLAHEPSEVQLLDVREPEEVAIAEVAGFKNWPLSEFDRWSAELCHQLSPDQEILVLCHHGVRSAYVCRWLQSQGYLQVKNIAGGIDAYSRRVDPTVPRY